MLGDGIVSFGVAVVDLSLQEREVVAEDGVVERTSLPSTRSAAGVNSIVALGVVELDRRGRPALRDAAELVDEVHVPGGAAELAVGRRLQADVLLHAHRVADGLVLDRAQLLGVDRPGRVVARAPASSSGGRSRLPT